MRITFVGHLCVDLNVVRGVPHTLCGGGVLHGGVTARRLGADVTVVTKCAEADLARFVDLAEAGVSVVRLPSEASTSIQNDYPNENPDERTSRVLSRAAPFTAADLEALEADVLHVNPLWCGEFPADLLPLARGRTRVLAADAQGFLRTVLPDGRTEYRDWPDKGRYLPLLDVFKVDAKEARTLTGLDEPAAAARALHELGARTVVLTHRDGVCVFDGRELCDEPFGSWTLEGRTGRGDTCTAAFLVARESQSTREAARFAAQITSRKMQYRGPYRGEP
jgi:sugar/nucleoside kinase (ribokinase family)